MKDYDRYPVPDVKDLRQFVDYSIRKYGDRDAFRIRINKDKYYSVSYNEFERHLKALAAVLHERGFTRKKVAVMGQNSYEWVLTYLAVVNSNNIVVPVDKELNEEGVSHIFSQTEPDAFFFTDWYADMGEFVQKTFPECKMLVNITRDAELFEGSEGLYDLLKRGQELVDAGDTSYTDPVLDENAVCTIIYTSGTTGLSKGVMLSHKNLTSNFVTACSLVLIKSGYDVCMSVMPIHHTFEFSCSIMSSILSGVPICFNDGLKNFASNLKLFSPTVMFTVPLIVENLYRKVWEAAREQGKEKKLKTGIKISNMLLKIGIDVRRKLFSEVLDGMGGRLELLICGGSPLNSTLSKKLRELGILLFQGYGVTECSPLITTNRNKYYRDNAVGIVFDCCRVRIMDLETHTECKPGQPGEIQVKGDNVMLGYYNAPELTQEAFDEGWYKTGDVGYFDNDGFLFLYGRTKNVILLKNGENIYPEEIENMLLENDLVREVVVRPGSGDNIAALIYPDPDRRAQMDEDRLKSALQEVIDRVNDRLPYYNHVAEFEIRDKEFEKTTTKKIMRFKI